MRPEYHVMGLRFHFKRMLNTGFGQKTLILGAPINFLADSTTICVIIQRGTTNIAFQTSRDTFSWITIYSFISQGVVYLIENKFLVRLYMANF